MPIRKMLDKTKILRMLMVGIWLGFLMLGVYSSKMEEKGRSGCCRGNKEKIKVKTQNLEIGQSLQDKERQLEVVSEKMTQETDENKSITSQLESRIEAQTLEIDQTKKITKDKEDPRGTSSGEFRDENE